LLNAAAVQILPLDPEHDDARFCLDQYTQELNRRSDRTYLHGKPIGCGAVKHHHDAPAEIKRMWIAPDARGLGLGRRLLQTLESCARDAGACEARIETNSDLTEAMALYVSAGWHEVDAFNAEPFADRWLQKSLVQ
jgi:GNAT superfamily N-acetyltransferase